MDYQHLFEGASWRVVLPIPIDILVFATPAIILGYIATTPTSTLSTKTKQILSFPFLIGVMPLSMAFMSGQKILDILTSLFTYNVFIRFLELIWLGPILNGREAYISSQDFHEELWSCLRSFPRPAKYDTKTLKKGEVKTYVKDRKFYHIIPLWFTHYLVCDIIGAWFSTFSAHDAKRIYAENTPLFFFIFAGVVVIMTSAFNVLGYTMQMFYVLYYEGGSYSSEQWHELMRNPVISTSITSLWSERWHRLLRSTWIAFPFKTTRSVLQKLMGKPTPQKNAISSALASFSVFIVSSVMHEFFLYSNLDWPVYREFYMGGQIYFFMIQATVVVFEKTIGDALGRRIPTSFTESLFGAFLKWLWVIICVFPSFHLFVLGYTTLGAQFSNPFHALQPYILDYVRKTPEIHPFFGSLL
ncbi:hypothetical protein CLU79DRAFT_741825 [Phycomyces nitens]|nr:hypothetical protein CLU79DRAFT_741825 [Phycomyces nitens]